MDTMTPMMSGQPQSDGLTKESSTFYNLTHSQSLYSRDSSPMKHVQRHGLFGQALSMEDLDMDEDQVRQPRRRSRTVGDDEEGQVQSADAVTRKNRKKHRGSQKGNQQYASETRLRAENTFLPPIDGRQGTFVREKSTLNKLNGVTTWGTPGSVQQIQNQHWNPAPRRIRNNVSKKIVHHLRKQFLRRIDRRFNDYFDEDEMYEEVEHIKEELHHNHQHQQQHQQHHHHNQHHHHQLHHQPNSLHGHDLEGGHWRYDHIITEEDTVPAQLVSPTRRTPIQVQSRPASKGEVRFSTSTPTAKMAAEKLLVSVVRPSYDSENFFPGTDPLSNSNLAENDKLDKPHRLDSRQSKKSRGSALPDIKGGIEEESSKSSSLSEHPQAQQKDEESIEGTGNLITKGGIAFGSHSAKSKRVFDLTGLKTREQTEIKKDYDSGDEDLSLYINKFPEEKVDATFNHVDVSPVPTPYIFSRPQTTRTARKMTKAEKLMKVIHGQVHVRVSDTSRVLKMFVHSCGIDTEAERSYLIENVYPRLRQYYKLKGYDLEVVDLLWGASDIALDDHGETLLTQAALKACRGNNKGISFMSFMSQKYGEAELPVSIPRDEIDAMLKLMGVDYTVILQAVERKLIKKPETPIKVESIASEVSSTGTNKKNQWEKVRRTSERSTGKSLLSVAKSISKSVTPSSMKSPPVEEVDEVDAEAEAQAELERAQMEKLKRVKDGTYSLRSLAVECEVLGNEEVFPDDKLLKTWYLLDENSVPAEYHLEPISSQFPDITAKDRQHRHEATESWRHIKQRLLSMLSVYSKKAGLMGYACNKYTSSEMAKVLEQALSSSPVEPPLSCLWVTREMLEIMQSLDDGKVKDYLDLSDVRRGQINKEAQTKLAALTGMANKLIPKDRRMRYTIQWNRNGVNPESVRTHATYMHHMCKDIFDKIISMHACLDNDLTDQVKAKKELANEVLAHTTFAQKKAYSFYGRKDILKKIKQYVRSNCNKPLVVHGKPGSGITSLLAKAAIDTHSWLSESNIAVVQRVVGATSSSANVRLLLKSLALQLCEIYNEDPTTVSLDYKSLSNQFFDRLASATDGKQLIIFIDSMHLLSDEHDARKLTWIPKELPPRVKMIISTDPSDKYECLTQLKRMLPKSEDFFIEVSDLSQKDATIILDEWYSRTNRQLSIEQKVYLLECFKKCPLPLYLKMLYLESLKWKSHTEVKSLKIHATIKGMTTIMFANLEKKHGEPLVRRAIGYVTAARNGLSSTEMEDVLSLDEAVMADVALHTKLQRRRLPPLFWARLRHDIDDYIEELNCDDTVTMRWTHSLFKEAAVERYLNSKDKAPSYHKALAEYFMNAWYEQPKPHPGNERGSQRCVMEQPLYTEISLAEDQPKDTGHDENTDTSDESSQDEKVVDDVPKVRQFNLRRLSELPFHLLRSAQNEQLKTLCLCNFEFVLAKITAFTLRVFFEDLEMALSVEPNDKDLKLLSDTLFLSSKVLTNDTKQLPSQIVGRLYEIITKDLPVAPQDPVNYPFLKPFLKGARQPSIPAIVPSTTCLTNPGGTMYDLLSGHSEAITAVHISPDSQYVFTSSLDNTIKVWEMRTGRVVKTLVGVGKEVKQIRLGLEGKLIITSEENCVRIWERKSGLCTKKLKLDDASSLCIVMDSCLVAFTHGTNMMISLDLNKLVILKHIDVKENTESQIHQDRSVIASMNGIGPAVLYAFRSYFEAVVRNAINGEVVTRLKCRDGASIQGLGCTNQYYICAARYRYQKTHEVFFMEVFDCTNGKLIRSVRGCTDDDITDIFINNLGSHAIGLCTSETANTSNIAVWNVETQDHKHVATHTQMACAGACVDLKQCLTTCENENTIRVWNLLGLVNKPAPKQKSKSGILELIKIASEPERIIAKSTTYGNLAIWDVTTGQRMDKGIKIGAVQDKNDIIKFFDTTAVILSDKSINSEGGNTIYQTLLSFDLKTKEFTNQVKDCFIFECPEHEYTLLDANHIMGLSEARSHFVVWTLHTGQLSYRIKPNFRGRQKEQISPVMPRKQRNHTAKMLPWERRLETKSARQRRHQADVDEYKEHVDNLRKEKENAIDQYIISADRSIIVASFFAHHMCVLDVQKQEHIQTLENYDSMMLLYIAALTPDGSHLVHANYDDESKTSYLTLWHCRSGEITRRIRNEKGICAVAINTAATKIVFGKSNQELRIWEPHVRRNPVRRIHGYSQLNFGVDSQIHITENDSRAVVFAGDISLWDLNKEVLLSVFTPEAKIQCFDVVLNGKVIVFGMNDSADLVFLKLRSKDIYDPDISEDEDDGKSGSDSEED